MAATDQRDALTALVQELLGGLPDYPGQRREAGDA